MEIVLIVVFALLGAAFGSFTNVCSDRLPAGKSIIRPASHCDACQRRLTTLDLIPVFSYLWLRGRCHSCRAPIPRRTLWVELSMAGLFAVAFWQYGLSLEFVFITLYLVLLILITVIDLEHHLILNKIVYPSAVAVLIIDVFRPEIGIVNGLIGGGIGFGIFFLVALVFPRGMGWGDVKLAALIGLVTGYPQIFVALLLGIIGGGLVAGLLLLLRLKRRREAIPFGPFLAVATMVTLFWGTDILNWYLGLF